MKQNCVTGQNASLQLQGIYGTPTMHYILSGSQSLACQKASQLFDEKERLELNIGRLGREQEILLEGLAKEHRLKAQELQRNLDQAITAVESAEKEVEKWKEQSDFRATRFAAIVNGELTPADRTQIELNQQTKCEKLDSHLVVLARNGVDHQETFLRIQENEKSLAIELNVDQIANDHFDKNQLAPHLMPLIEAAGSRAMIGFDVKLEELKRGVGSIDYQLQHTRMEVLAERQKLRDAKENLERLRALKAKGIAVRVFSATWWASNFTDYERRVEESETNTRTLSTTCTRLSDRLSVEEAEISNFTGSRSAIFSTAVQRETDLLRNQCRERAAELSAQIAQLQSDGDTQQAILQSNAAELVSVRGLRDEAANRAREDAIKELTDGALAAVDEARVELASAKAQLVQHEKKGHRCRAEVEDYERGRLEEIDRCTVPLAAQLKEVQLAISHVEQKIAQTLGQAGVQKTKFSDRKEFESMREELKIDSSPDRLFKRFQRGPRKPHLKSDSKNKRIPAKPRNGEVRNFYIDLQSQAEDFTDKNGKTRPGLHTQLAELRRRHSNLLFPESEAGVDLLDQLRLLLFPEGIPQNFLISNLCLQRDRPLLAVRPSNIGPRLEKVLPRGVTISMKGRLWINSRDPNDAILRVNRIMDLSHSETRDFEAEVVAFAHTNELRQRTSNLLTKEFVSDLPDISIRTAQNIRDWKSYLDWQERLITANTVGLRYVSVAITANDRIQFLAVADSKESFDRIAKSFRRSESLRAFPLDYSESPWKFEFSKEFKGYSYELGEFERIVEASDDVMSALRTTLPWASAYAANVCFWVADGARIGNPDGRQAEPTELLKLPRNLHSEGFLSPSMVGDLIPIGRQRSELNLLQEQSGYAPFLSSYLFDIGNANVPGELLEISDQDWTRNDLNEEQKMAIRKMVSTPDLGMVQGPPGTGKTTMIAEATSQFVLQRRKVLLVSQANLAVENALERLSASSAIRAIRLGKKADADGGFSKQRALGTYYANIASDCRSNSLSLWERSDHDRTLIRRNLADCDLMDIDISLLQTAVDEAQRAGRVASEELRRFGDRESRQRTLMATRSAVSAFIGFLDGSHCGSLQAIPEFLLDAFFELVVTPIDELAAVGMQANRIWHGPRYGTLSDRSLYTMEILAEWNRLLADSAQLRGDLKRLQATDGEFVMDAEQALELARLQRLLSDLQEAMIDDASRVDEWRDTQRIVRDIKRKGSGLDQTIYRRVFSRTDKDQPPYLIYVQGNALRVDVIAALENAVKAIELSSKAVNVGLSEVRERAIRCICELDGEDGSDPTSLRQAEATLSQATAKADELSVELNTKRARLIAGMVGLGTAIGQTGIAAVGEYQVLRQAALDYMSALPDQSGDLQTFRQDWETLIRTWVEDLECPDTATQDASSFLDTYISACNVVGVTCAESRKTLESSGHTRFDVAIVDEVSKTTPTEILMPLMLAQTAILVGDHRQLPPLFKEQSGSWEEAIADREESPETSGEESDSELTAENLERFRKMVTASLFKQHFEEAPDGLKSSLMTQYRMHPQIMRVINHFYENRLSCGLTDPDRKTPGSDIRGHRVHEMTLNGPAGLPYLVPEQHVLWIDSHADPMQEIHFEQTAGVGGKLNQLEADLIAKIIIDIEFSCRLQGYGQGGKSPKEIGVVSFYGKQIKAIRESAEKHRIAQGIQFTAVKFDINTVDRYQGQERPIIIVSMVRNPKGKLSPRANTAQFERINVAFSRAQELLIVVGSSNVFSRYPVDLPFLDRPGKRKVDVYKHIIEEIRSNGGFWQASNIIDPKEYGKLCMMTNRAGRR